MTQIPDRPMRRIHAISTYEATSAALRQIAIGVFAVIPVLSVIGYMAFLRAFRPHVTDIYAGYILPYKSDAVTVYLSQQDWAIIRGFDLWAMAAVTFALFYYWRVWVSIAAKIVRRIVPRKSPTVALRNAA